MGPRLFRRGNLVGGAGVGFPYLASMGPRLFRRGNDKLLLVRHFHLPASMGPRLFRRGNIFTGFLERSNIVASMGPRLFRRGNEGRPASEVVQPFCFNGATSFQTWKCQFWSVTTGADLVASMGPRLFRRGNLKQDVHRLRVNQASMGPRLFRRGNKVYVADCKAGTLLQWGHVFSDVEMLTTAGVRDPDYVASMGPRLFRRGNGQLYRRDRAGHLCFNGATSFQTWKCMCCEFPYQGPPSRFNGATSFQTWK